jgi:hypothetical protein
MVNTVTCYPVFGENRNLFAFVLQHQTATPVNLGEMPSKHWSSEEVCQRRERKARGGEKEGEGDESLGRRERQKELVSGDFL